MDQLNLIRAQSRADTLIFDQKQRCFVLTNNASKVRGLTRALDRLLPALDVQYCPERTAPRNVCVSLLNDDDEPIILKQQSSLPTSVATVIGVANRVTSTMQVANLPPPPRAPRATKRRIFCFGGRTDRAHGLRVDGQVCALIAGGATKLSAALAAIQGGTVMRAGRRDPCANGVLLHLKQLGWQPLAAQVPIHLRTLNLATAIDFVCTDLATHTKLIIVELKATRCGTNCTTCNSPLSTCRYAAADARAPPVLVAHATNAQRVALELINSSYTRHQLQLWAMVDALRVDYRVRVDAAYVLRVGACGHTVTLFPLDSTMVSARAHLVQWLNRHVDNVVAAPSSSSSLSTTKRPRTPSLLDNSTFHYSQKSLFPAPKKAKRRAS